MIDPISALERQIQQMFFGDLIGVYGWDHVHIAPREKALRIPGKPLPDGKWVEMLSAKFGPYTVEAWTPNEKPPLGWIKCETAGGVIVEGPLTSDTWRKLAAKIKSDQTVTEEPANV